MRVAISQPTYLPWLGYIDLIDQVDCFVILDNVQFEKQSWQQRNRIKAPSGLQWLTVPVIFRGRLHQQINEVEIREPDFWRDHIRALELNYRRAPFFSTFFAAFRDLLRTLSTSARLMDLNVGILRWILQESGIKTPIAIASELNVSGKRTQLLADICVALSATSYLSPIGSANYLLDELHIMTERGIDVNFQQYNHPVYRQLFPPFLPQASVLDVIFNEGDQARKIIASGRGIPFSPSQVAGLVNRGVEA